MEWRAACDAGEHKFDEHPKKQPFGFLWENEGLSVLAQQIDAEMPPVGLEQSDKNPEKSGVSALERSICAPFPQTDPADCPPANPCETLPEIATTTDLTPTEIISQAVNLSPDQQTALITALLQQLTSRANAQPREGPNS